MVKKLLKNFEYSKSPKAKKLKYWGMYDRKSDPRDHREWSTDYTRQDLPYKTYYVIVQHTVLIKHKHLSRLKNYSECLYIIDLSISILTGI